MVSIRRRCATATRPPRAGRADGLDTPSLRDGYSTTEG
jgi:hypothetical protein